MPVETNIAPSEGCFKLRASGGSYNLPPTTCPTESCRGSNVCLQCGRLALPISGSVRVCWDTDCAQGAGPIYDTRLPGFSVVLLSDVRRLGADQAPYDLLPLDFMDTSSDRSIELDTLLASRVDGLDLGARIGVLVFFRLLKSLEQRRNTRGILKLIRQVPSMITNTPVLFLSPHVAAGKYPGGQTQVETTTTALAGLTTGACLGPGGVVDAIMSAAEGLLCGEHELSNQQQADVLEATVGLAVKRGSPAHCLRVIKLLLCSAAGDRGLSIPGVGHHLKVLMLCTSQFAAVQVYLCTTEAPVLLPCVPSIPPIRHARVYACLGLSRAMFLVQRGVQSGSHERVLVDMLYYIRRYIKQIINY